MKRLSEITVTYKSWNDIYTAIETSVENPRLYIMI